MNDLQKRLDQLYNLLESSLDLSKKYSTEYITSSNNFTKDNFYKSFEIVKTSIDEISTIINLKSNSDFTTNEMFKMVSKLKIENVGM